MKDNSTMKNIFELVKSSLIGYGGIDEMMIFQKLACVGVDRALVMQGHKNGLLTKLKYFLAPCSVGIHCMVHIMNLAFGIVSNSSKIYRVEVLIKEIYRHFFWRPKWFREFQLFSERITNGKNIFKDNDTRWMFLEGPTHWFVFEYPSLFGTMESTCDDQGGQWKYGELFERLSNVETLLMLAILLL